MRPEDFLAKQDEPFTQKEFLEKTKLSLDESKMVLKDMIAKKILGFRKIGRMNVYWTIKYKSSVKPEKKDKKTTLTDYIKITEPLNDDSPQKESEPEDPIQKLHDRIHVLESERDLLLNENNKIKHEFERFQARFSDEEDVWREVAEKLAASLAEMRGVTIKEVLKYFEAPHY